MKNKKNEGARRNIHDEIEGVSATLSGLGRTLRELQNEFSTHVKGLVEFEKNLNAIAGGALPRVILPDMEAVQEIFAHVDDMTDGDFVSSLAKVAATSDAVKRLSTLLSVFVGLRKQIQSYDNRIQKLADRVGADSGVEKNVAKVLKGRLVDARAVWERRLSLTLCSIFETRTYVLKSVVKVGEILRKEFPDGDVILRDAYLKHSAEALTSTVVAHNAAWSLGKRKISNAGRKGGVSI